MPDEADILSDLDQLRSRYRVLRYIGQDDGCAVYAVLGRDSEQHYLVKVMRKPGSGSMQAGTLHLWQAQTMERLDHPGLLVLHTVNHLQGGTLALAMERRRGPTLAERIESEGPLPIVEVESTLRSLVEALVYLHGRGVLHRGVNPDSILFDLDSACARLAHFGIPRGGRGGEARTDESSHRAAASEGAPASRGSACRASNEGPRDDLYHLGFVGYLCLTGHAFDPQSGASGGIPRLETLRGDAPPYLCRAIEGCLDRDPGRRWRSAEELLARLAPTSEHTAPLARDLPDIGARVADAISALRRGFAETLPSIRGRSLAAAVPALVSLLVWAAWSNRVQAPGTPGELAEAKGSGDDVVEIRTAGRQDVSEGLVVAGASVATADTITQVLEWRVVEPVAARPSPPTESSRSRPRAVPERPSRTVRSREKPARGSIPPLLGEELASNDSGR